MKQVTYYVGIDIAKDTFTTAIFVNPETPSIVKENFSNTLEGFDEFINWLSSEKVTPEDSLVCMETTGVYTEQLCYYLHAKGYNVSVHDAARIAKSSPKANKNDRTDSQKVAEYAYRHYDELTPWIPKSEILEQMEVLLTIREQFIKQKSANINVLKALKLKHVQTPLANSMLQESIDTLKQKIKDIEKELRDLIDKDQNIKEIVSLLDSVPGVDLLLGVNMVVLTNGFDPNIEINYKHMASLLGIAPNEHTSGKSIRKKTKSKGFGPPRLRKLLYLAARSLRTHNKSFKEYFYQKLKKGKPKKLIFNNIANKLLKIMCAIIKSKKAYVKDHVSVNPLILKNNTKKTKKS